MQQKPNALNSKYFSTETFPEIIGFCEQDPLTKVINDGEESYEYKLNGEKIYLVKHKANKWEIVEFFQGLIVRVSINTNLGKVLTQALTYSQSPSDKQEDRVSILIPINTADLEKALAVMYYLGGYPTNFLTLTPELKLITDRFVMHGMSFLSYSYVPVHYLPWLTEELKTVGIIGQDPSRSIVMYKK